MGYSSKYTREEAKIAREIDRLTNRINDARTEKTKNKHLKSKTELIKKLNGKYGTGVQKLPDRYGHQKEVITR